MARYRKILIVEDEKDQREILEISLTCSPLEVVIVPDGIEALSTLLRGIKEDCSYPVIILDCAMPFADGFTIAQTIRCLEKNHVLPHRTRIGMYTGYPQLLAPGLIEENHIDHFIPKTEPEALIEMVTKLVGELDGN